MKTSIKGVEEATSSVIKMRPKARIIIIADNDDEGTITNFYRLGIKSLLVRVTPIDEIIWAIRTVNLGGYYFPNRIGKVFQKFIRREKEGIKKDLDEFDYNVLKLTVEGFSSSEISKFLHRSPRTIEDHRQKLYNIFDVKNKVELIILATKYNLI